jgi:hypothetical protein
VRRYAVTAGNLVFNSVTADGRNDPAALAVEFSIDKGQWDGAINSYIRLLGVSRETLKHDFTNQPVVVYGGFLDGMPLAHNQSLGNRYGMLIQSTVRAGFGNWRGTEISLDLIIAPAGAKVQANPSATTAPSPGVSTAPPVSSNPGARLARRARPTAYAPGRRATPLPQSVLGDASSAIDAIASGNIGGLLGALEALARDFGAAGDFRAVAANLIHNLQPGQWLGDALTQSYKTAFPDMNVVNMFSSVMKTAYQDAGILQNSQQLSSYVKTLSSSLSQGQNIIDTYIHGSTITHSDGTQPASHAVTLDFTDLIGQPTWEDIQTIAFDTVMRADIIPECDVTLPNVPYSVAVTGSSQSTIPTYWNRSLLTFQGTFKVFKCRHVGVSRSPDGMQWRTSCWARAPNSSIAQSTQANVQSNASNADLFYGSPAIGTPGGPSSPHPGPHRLLHRGQRAWP